MSAPATTRPAVGTPTARLDATAKVSGSAQYSYEIPMAEIAYVWPVASTVSRGEIVSIDVSAAIAMPGVIATISHEDEPGLSPHAGAHLALFASPEVTFRGQWVAAVVATTLEVARAAADAVKVGYTEQGHDVLMHWDHPGRTKVAAIFGRPAYESVGDPESAFAAAEVQLDESYGTPAEHVNPLEPHASTASWTDDRLVVHDACQTPTSAAAALATIFGIDPANVEVISDFVGGGFGSKLGARQSTVLAALASRTVHRPVKMSMTRSQEFTMGGYRPPTLQRIRIGADADGRFAAILHDSLQQRSVLGEFVEPTAMTTRMMYATRTRHTGHDIVILDVPAPSPMRGPGRAPGTFALECAVDELAERLGIDPIELRVRNEPTLDPDTGNPFSARSLLPCLREGAEQVGWQARKPLPAQDRRGRWWYGLGVASAVHPSNIAPSTARVTARPDGGFDVEIAALDVGTGARTVITQVAADSLRVSMDDVRTYIGRSSLPPAMGAGGSMGTVAWTWAVREAASRLRAQLDAGAAIPAEGLSVEHNTADDVQGLPPRARHAFGAQFAQVRVDAFTGEIRVARLVGVFAAGKIINPPTARSQLLGGMTMGLSMALHEESVLDLASGMYVNHDFASYHIASNADIEQIDITMLDEVDNGMTPVGAKGVGEIGIIGTASAIANAVYNAVGVRVRELPITLDKLIGRLPAR